MFAKYSLISGDQQPCEGRAFGHGHHEAADQAGIEELSVVRRSASVYPREATAPSMTGTTSVVVDPMSTNNTVRMTRAASEALAYQLADAMSTTW